MTEPQYHPDFGEYKSELQPFTKFNWKSAQSRDAWVEPYQRMTEAKDEAEWLSVMDDNTDRKAAIIHVSHNNRDKWLQRVGENDLHYRGIRYSAPYDGFSHEFIPAQENDPERITYAVIAENSDIADQMEEAELEKSGYERHTKVGKLLGFPECCRDFFYENFVENGIRDPMYEVACNSGNASCIEDNCNHIRIEDPNPGNNILWRYFGLSYITHFPCSWDCENSLEVARDRYRVMAENGYEEAADHLNEWLRQPFEWSGYHGIAHIESDHVTASSNTSNYLDEKQIVWDSR